MQGLDGLMNPSLGRGTDLSGAVDNVRNRGTRNTGEPGDIVNGSDNRPPSSLVLV